VTRRYGVYVHVPFCRRKCGYCDFYSTTNLDLAPAYLAALLEEIDRRAEGGSVESIYLGGGTPSTLAPAAIGRILGLIAARFAVEEDAEITMEANPGALSRGRLADYRAAGVNRLSVGVQSFRSEELRFLERIHTAAEARETVAAASKSGFARISVDLMFGTPGQTLAAHRENLLAALALPVEHLSVYSLTYEPETPLGRALRRGEVTPASGDHDADLYETTIDLLAERGFRRYETSSFAPRGAECRHNLRYWRRGEYYGFGPAAHSFLAEARRANLGEVGAYARDIREGGTGARETERLTREDALVETIMLSLRAEGIDLAAFGEAFGAGERSALLERASAEIERGRMELAEGRLRATRAGYPLIDALVERLIGDT
jgi:oxygen-independent coproporphyrinogen-3 oxidase